MSSRAEEPQANAKRSERKEETKRSSQNAPKASKLRQQNLNAQRPLMTARVFIPLVFLIGALTTTGGVFFLRASNSVREWGVRYDRRCALNSTCEIDFHLDEVFSGDVYFYYQLENFFQNHRRYVKNFSPPQLLGDVKNVPSCKGEYCCEPFGTDDAKVPYAPCGMIANSMFNDTFRLYRVEGSRQTAVPLTHRGVLSREDWTARFRNPPIPKDGDLCSAFNGTTKPPNWSRRPCELDRQHAGNNGFENVDFIVWMRTGGLPNIRKLHRLLDRPAVEDFNGGLPAGAYKLLVENNYPVEMFSGKKSFVISTTSWFGGRNRFLGVAYIVTGAFCLALGIFFLVVHLRFGHSLSEMADLPHAKNE
ncbi:CDC50 family protein chat-1 [Aphelenchoides fujianensis]|nr:CDC50 family protein chat-1 [Aphelenchoides fujianensis]